jgi:hypothetical protein
MINSSTGNNAFMEVDMKTQTHCYGCGNSFASYDMTQADGVVYDGKTFCNDDCQMEAEVDELENSMYMEECGLNSDGTEWY